MLLLQYKIDVGKKITPVLTVNRRGHKEIASQHAVSRVRDSALSAKGADRAKKRTLAQNGFDPLSSGL
jgi:hypothetical protein